ncbi:MAG: TFIIB-type zinc ribbon-containing protein [Planctomycetota bacterium]
MICFCCEQCDHKISVQDERAGKRCKCQQCGSVAAVPQRSTVVDFHCENCGRKISVPQVHAGKKGKCPKCGHLVVVPEQTELEAPAHERKEDVVDGLSLEERQILWGETRADESEQTDELKLPGLINAFIYPISTSGMIHLALFVISPLLFSLFIRFIEYMLKPHLGLATGEITEPITIIFYVIFYSYVCYYIADCVIGSSKGRQRAVDLTMPNTISIGDFVSEAFIIIGSIAICLSPMLLYSFLAKRNDLWFWALSAYGIFFLPMSLLRGIMFDAFDALNPIEIIRSICRAFLPYWGLVLFFLVVGGFIAEGIPRLPFWEFLKQALKVYLVFVLAHRLGWFYWRHKDKLKWGL